MIFLAWIMSGARGRKQPSFQLSIAFLFGVFVAIVISITLELLATALLSFPIVKEDDLFVKDTSMMTFLMVVIVASFIKEFAKLL
jgi:hypothetical protein